MKKFFLMLLLLFTLNGCTNEPDLKLSCKCFKSGKNEWETNSCPNKNPISITINLSNRLFKVSGMTKGEWEDETSNLFFSRLTIDETYIKHQARRPGTSETSQLNRMTLLYEHTVRKALDGTTADFFMGETVLYEVFQCQITNGIQ